MPILPSIQNSEADSDAQRLQEIADLIGLPREAFTDGAGVPLAMTGVLELLEIWDRLSTDGERDRLLSFARSLLSV